MRIGIDFDNTLVGYDRLFHRLASEAALIPPHVPATKTAIRDHLRAQAREHLWTELQGEAYGARMAEAERFPGVIEFLQWAADNDLETVIVSHKTRHPYRGPPHDLHGAARAWIAAQLKDARGPLLRQDQIYLELTKEEKFARIAALGCDYFIDDLREILEAPEFPLYVTPILFAPQGTDIAKTDLVTLDSWLAVHRYFEAIQRCA